MATYDWSNAQGGTWSTAGNWTPNGVPGVGDLALIDLAGSYVVTLDVPEIGSATLDAAGARLAPDGTLRLDGILDVRAGTLTVGHTIQGGTLAVDGGTITYDGGTPTASRCRARWTSARRIPASRSPTASPSRARHRGRFSTRAPAAPSPSAATRR